jgi:LCP family protein required for cell wall assembly
MVVNLFIATTLIVVGVLVVWANNKVGDRLVVNIDGGTTSATTPDGAPAEDWAYDTSNLRAKNFLLTGSDNGACPDKGDGTSGGIGDRESFGERSDTIMVLRVDPAVNDVVVLSFPRDLWVKIAGTTREARINSAFDSKDPSRLIRTIADNFDVPIDHYVNVNLCAFKEIVDSVGGVKVPFAYRTKDEQVGFREVGPGCVELRGSQALAYVRSRSGYRYFDETNQQWLSDPTGDIGRIARQQDFLRRSMQRALDRGTTNPATANALLNVALARVITDDRLTPRDLLSLAQAMRKLNTSSVNSYTVEWSMRRIGGESVLMPITDTESMQAIFALFRSGVAQDDESAFAPPSMRTASLVILPFAQLMLDSWASIETSDTISTVDTTLPPAPQQERLGVFPPDDPTCR